ncbi:MAG: MFS transporter, partial [Nitrospiraceae bacterium]
PPIVGTWSQLASVKILDHLKARKPLILAGALGQALALLPLFILPILVPSNATWLLLGAATIYFAMGHVTVPAWNSVITEVVDADGRGAYFAKRAKVIAVASFAALSVMGLTLHASESWKNPALGFGIGFLVASGARLISVKYLSRLPEASPAPATRQLGLREFIRHDRSLMFRRFLLFTGSFHLATMIAGPFFVIYLLRDLHLTYVQYGAWLAAPILGQLVSLQEWGRIGDTFGNKKVLVVTGLAIPVLPILYLFSTEWLILVAINFLSGFIWPGFSLCLQNYVFDIVSPEDRTKGVAVYSAVNALGTGAGALVGGWLASVTPSQILLFGSTLPLASNLPILFLASGVLRLVVSLTLLKTFEEGRTVTPISHLQLVHELPLIKPLAAAIGVRGARLR